MRRHWLKTLAATALCLAAAVQAPAQPADPIEGAIGSASGPGWQASWIDLRQVTTFKKGDKIGIAVQGTAKNVLVRLLPVGADANSPVGIEGKTRKVPSDRLVMVVLERDHPNVKQISVHAGANAWSTPLGADNGRAEISGIMKAR